MADSNENTADEILEQKRLPGNKSALLNPLIPKSDQHLISPHNITLESNIKVIRS